MEIYGRIDHFAMPIAPIFHTMRYLRISVHLRLREIPVNECGGDVYVSDRCVFFNKTPDMPAGSVAIAGSQAGIYPVDTPGGWRLIGRTPVPIFDPGATTPTLLKPGDLVEFREIDRATFDAMLHR